MSEHQKIELGKVITDPSVKRDAVHIAVMPMIATTVLQPGQHLQNGVVDPFLKLPVQPGERYFLCLFPNTITDLRHAWRHSAFPDEKEQSMADTFWPPYWYCPVCGAKSFHLTAGDPYCNCCVGDDGTPIAMLWASERHCPPITEKTKQVVRELKERVLGGTE